MKVQNYFLEKMKNKLILLLFITILSLQIVNALKINDLNIHDELSIDNSVIEVLNFNISKNLTETFRFSLPEKAYEITIDEKNYTENTSINMTLNCTVCRIRITFRLDNVVNNENSHLAYSRTLNVQTNISKLSYSVSLPPSHVTDLSTNVTDPSIVPSPTAIRTDGKLITVIWEETNPQLPNRYFIRYQRYNPQSFDMDSFLSEFSEWSVWVIIVISLAIGVITGIVLTRVYFKPKIKKVTITKIPASLLNPDEKSIITLLKQNKGKTNQKDMVKELSWSKSKVSAVVSNLEYKHIVKREKTGRNYSVELVKEIEDY